MVASHRFRGAERFQLGIVYGPGLTVREHGSPVVGGGPRALEWGRDSEVAAAEQEEREWQRLHPCPLRQRHPAAARPSCRADGYQALPSCQFPAPRTRYLQRVPVQVPTPPRRFLIPQPSCARTQPQRAPRQRGIEAGTSRSCFQKSAPILPAILFKSTQDTFTRTPADPRCLVETRGAAQPLCRGLGLSPNTFLRATPARAVHYPRAVLAMEVASGLAYCLSTGNIVGFV